LLRHDREQSFYTIFGGGGGGGGGVGLADLVVRMDQSGNFQTITNLGLFSSPGLYAINGFAPGSFFLAPMNVSANGFLLEAGVWGQPGELALLAITVRPAGLRATRGRRTSHRRTRVVVSDR
jgi:hypothetical protein